jgi:polysaccharide export outer membrane protein
MTQAKAAIEEHLSQFFLKPEVALSITGYNSKVFYVIFDSGFNGGGILFKLPVTGNETVIDAISQVGGLSTTADYKRIWIARPAPLGSCPQVLPVDWKAITEDADVATNYQILPGDRLFVKAAPMVSFGARVDRFLAPIERIMGFFLLTQNVINNRNNNGNFGGFGF